MSVLDADSPVQFVRGVGPRRAEWFAAMGVRTVGELLAYFPFRYEADQGEVEIVDLEPGQHATIRGIATRVGGRRPNYYADLDDGGGTCTLRWFNLPDGGPRIFRGALVVASGKIEVFNDSLQMVQPRVQVFSPDAALAAPTRGQRAVGVYRGAGEATSLLIRRTVQAVLTQSPLPVAEILPTWLLERRTWPPREHAVRCMHAPPAPRDAEQARARLAYEELLMLEIVMAVRRRRRAVLGAAAPLRCTPEIDARIRRRFPFALTASQSEVVRQIARDLGEARPMTRLLQGDVGSGKTVVALYACLVAVANRRQAAIMAPTEILAEQHFRSIERYLAGSRVRAVLLQGRMPKSKRASALEAIDRGELDLVVGTQALVQRDVSFHDLALVVVDEQHKFGVLQRHTFRTKGGRPHYLVMTATPIPRTLAMTVFGDLDVSVIRRGPPGRGRIVTRVAPSGRWGEVMAYVRKRLEGGEQAYVVCPHIGGEAAERESEDRAGAAPPSDSGAAAAATVSATAEFERLQSGPWRGLSVALLHGGLPTAQKRRIVEDFLANRLQALVATTVVEVGVDVANATIMIVQHAERFGLAQLHQLRGRVGRGAKDSLCVLIDSGRRGGKSNERLGVMARTTDGFEIAEADLKLRGPGQLFGTKQHGLPELAVANLVEDFKLLEMARDDAAMLVERDPELKAAEHQALLAGLRRMFGEKLSLIDAA